MALSRRRLLQLTLASLGVGLTGRRGLAGPGGSSGHLHWLATADSGSGDRHQLAVGAAMAALHRRDPADLVILGGDNIYNEGEISRVDAAFERPYRDLLRARVPFHAVLGNHDIRTANGAGQLAYPGFGMKGRWYTLRRGPVEFLMLDTNGNAAWQHQLPWLKRVLAASSTPWKVVVGHHPIYSSGLYGDDRTAIARLTPLFQRHGVQLYIHGHDHNYERSRPIDGTTYLNVGNGGATLRPVVPGPNSVRAVSTYGFASMHADAGSLTIEAWNASGQQLDRARLDRGGALI